MITKNTEDISPLKRYWNIISHGLFLFGLRNRLANIGLDINPYYWVQEEVDECKEPKIKGNPLEYSVRFLNVEEFKSITENESGATVNEMIEGLKKGQLCIGLEHNGNIAAYTFIELHDFVYYNRTFKLKDNEAYLLNMWTFHSYRGKNLAPYLRYQSYKLLDKQGRTVKYSITQYFNKSSIKFKSKLNSKHLSLFISIALFKKYYWNFPIKKYR
ncbi:hypothetical protein V8G69_13675 [Gaetbulibacter sp. M235]|uniref:hypothetical protein n=1 Tax=Gaetbulibacter sp. M235 TaxID=3126510 RepID=UPI00374E7247